jgi:hypothetical protein
MKKIIIALICSSVLFNGCYSYYSISEQYDGEIPEPEKNIVVYLNDDSIIESKAHQHIYNLFTSNLYYGEYWDINKRTGTSSEITGWLSEFYVDSCHYSEIKERELLTCYKGNDNEFIFSNLIHQLNDAKGFYAAVDDGKKLYGPIELSDIKDIKVKEIDILSTTLLSLGVASVVYLLIGILTFKPIGVGSGSWGSLN